MCPYVHIPGSSTWKECLTLLIKFWTRLADEMQEVNSSDTKTTCQKKSGKRRLLESTFNGNKEGHVSLLHCFGLIEVNLVNLCHLLSILS